jgi:myo-inositol-hexaphosphate 3-phosphohydrolase
MITKTNVSYLVTYWFPSESNVYDLDAKLIQMVNDVPIDEVDLKALWQQERVQNEVWNGVEISLL